MESCIKTGFHPFFSMPLFFIKLQNYSAMTDLFIKITVMGGLVCTLLLTALTNKTDLTTDNQNYSEVEIRALHDHENNLHLFDMNTNEVSSGWTTFTFTNASDSDHFAVIYRVPDEAITAAAESGDDLLDHWYKSVTTPFQEEYNNLADGSVDYGVFVDSLVQSISEKGPWFFEPGAPAYGGPGFTSAGLSSKTTVYLDPGSYVIECYVKDENETFHSYIGMLELLTVTDEESGIENPTSSGVVTISSESGISMNGDIQPGDQTIEITFEDQIAHEHLLGHNVQLLKLSGATDHNLLTDVAGWMDWRTPGGLVNRGPEGVQFLGGSMEMIAGGKAYFHVDIEPGEYAWIAEVPNPEEKNMIYRFTIPD